MPLVLLKDDPIITLCLHINLSVIVYNLQKFLEFIVKSSCSGAVRLAISAFVEKTLEHLFIALAIPGKLVFCPLGSITKSLLKRNK